MFGRQIKRVGESLQVGPARVISDRVLLRLSQSNWPRLLVTRAPGVALVIAVFRDRTRLRTSVLREKIRLGRLPFARLSRHRGIAVRAAVTLVSATGVETAVTSELGRLRARGRAPLS